MSPTVLKVRHALNQYLYMYNDARLTKTCTDILAKSDAYIELNYKVELFKIFRKFGNPFMDRTHNAAVKNDWDDIFFAGYLAKLDPETQSLLK